MSSRGRGGARGGFKPPKAGGTGGEEIDDDQCRYCKKTGHWAQECRKKKRDDAAHATQAEEEIEPTLLVAMATVNAAASSTPPSSRTPADSSPIHLKEDKLFVQLGGNGEGDCA